MIILLSVIAILLAAANVIIGYLLYKKFTTPVPVFRLSDVSTAIAAKAITDFSTTSIKRADLERYSRANYLETCYLFGLPPELADDVVAEVNQLLSPDKDGEVIPIESSFLFEGAK